MADYTDAVLSEAALLLAEYAVSIFEAFEHLHSLGRLYIGPMDAGKYYMSSLQSDIMSPLHCKSRQKKGTFMSSLLKVWESTGRCEIAA